MSLVAEYAEWRPVMVLRTLGIAHLAYERWLHGMQIFHLDARSQDCASLGKLLGAAAAAKTYEGVLRLSSSVYIEANAPTSRAAVFAGVRRIVECVL